MPLPFARNVPEKAGGFGGKLLEIFLLQRPRLCRFIGRIVRADEIEDIVQDTFVHTYAASRNQQIHNPSAYMYRTARHLALNLINRSDHKLNSSIEDIDDFDLDSEVDLVEEQCHSDDKFLCFCRAVASLPLHCRRVFILKKVYGLSQKEIARSLHISPSTVEKHIARGLLLTAAYMLGEGHAVLQPKTRMLNVGLAEKASLS